MHGYIRSYTETSYTKQIKGRRVICNKRRKRKSGCGRTIAFYLSQYVPGLWYTLTALWELIGAAVDGNPINKLQILHASLKTTYRMISRFKRSQYLIREKLCTRVPPPDTESAFPYTQTIRHLQKYLLAQITPLLRIN